MIPALQASRRSSPAESRWPVSVTPIPSPRRQDVEGDGDHEGERGPVHARQVRQVVLQQLHEPVAEQRGVGELLAGLGVEAPFADPPRRRQRFEGFLQQVGVQGGELEPALAGPVAVVAGGEVRQGAGFGFFLGEQLGFFGVGCFGADDLEESFAELFEGGGVELHGRGRPCGPRPWHASRPGGRRTRLVNVSTARMTIRAFSTSIPPSARAARVAWNVSSSLVARWRSAWRADGAGPRLVCQPGRRRGRTALGADLVAVGLREHPQLELLEPRPLPAQRDQGLAFLGRAHRPQRRLGEPVQRRGQRVEEPHHRMRRRRRAGRRRRRCDRQAS